MRKRKARISVRNPWLVAAVAGAMALGFAKSGRAAERLLLANGFDVVCDHHATVEGRVRVYLKAAEPDYFELEADSVKGVEMVADLPPQLTPDAGLVGAGLDSQAVKAVGQRPAVDERLSAADLHQLLSKAGSDHNVDEDLLASLVKAESGGHTRATSRAGAQGLMQLMPGTARELGVVDSFAAEQNVRGGTAYLDSLLTRYHDNLVLAVAAYNAGPKAVDRYHGVPPYRETRAYVARVVHEFNHRVAARERLARMNQARMNLAAQMPAMR